jgi:hypothetical protein
VKCLVLLASLGCLIVAPQPICAQESAKFEKIRDISPDQKFAMRISCGARAELKEEINHIVDSVHLEE